jgi:ArsR family transcriptional regulator
MGLDSETIASYIRIHEYIWLQTMKRMAWLFKALSDEARLRIINLLLYSGELCVCDIESVMKYTQTKVSRHLAYLRRVGLVDARRHGLWMLYSIAAPKSTRQKDLLDFLAALLGSDDVARKDARRLADQIKSGCCATYATVKPSMMNANATRRRSL